MPRTETSLHGLLKWVIAACVENDEAEFFCRIQNSHDAIERHGFVLYVCIALELRIDGQEVIYAVNFDAVAGVVHDGNIGIRTDIGASLPVAE